MSLNVSRTLLQKLASKLIITITKGKGWKKKAELRSDILRLVADSGNSLHENWIQIIEKGRNPWNITFDPLRKYKLPQIQEIAIKFGLQIGEKSIETLRKELIEKQRYLKYQESHYENKDHFPETLTKYRPSTSFSKKYRKLQVSLNNIPPDPAELARVINDVTRIKVEALLENNEFDDSWTRKTTIGVKLSISSYKKETNKPAESQERYYALEIKDIDEKTMQEWWDKIDATIQNLVGQSDEYAEVDRILEVDVYYKYFPAGGSGFVVFKRAKYFPEVYCPNNYSCCAFDVFDEAGLKFKEGITIHKIINDLHILNGFVPISKLGHILKYISQPVQIILHKAK